MELSEQSIVVLVGPNNSGKSRALRDIHTTLFSNEPADLAAITETTVVKHADTLGFRSWLEAHAHIFRPPAGMEMVVRPHVEQQTTDEALRGWEQGPPFRRLTSFLVLTAFTEGRLNLAGSAGAFDILDSRPTAPLHELFLDAQLEGALSDAVQRAFGRPITVNRAAGANIHLHVGAVENVDGPHDATNATYVQALRDLPRVEHEGDGVRSFIGLLLTVIASRFPLIIIDEPEAFLHPPQASQLGREIARLSPAGESQIILATHSADFLQGILDDPTASVTVVRLTREHNVNHAAVLPAEDLRDLWGDPILRYSGLLDGLFHKGVVLCEADSDCRFYQATLDATLTREERAAHDLFFSYTGGKDRLPVAIAALKAVKVPVTAIADLDVLREEVLLKRIIESLGARWESFERDWRVVHAEVGVLKTAPAITRTKEDLERVAGELTGDRLSRGDSDRIRSIVRVESGWSQIKRGGVSALPQGQATVAANGLLASLASIGLLVVPVGELERWAPQIPSHGPKWVSAALEAGVHEQPGAAADFIKQVAAD